MSTMSLSKDQTTKLTIVAQQPGILLNIYNSAHIMTKQLSLILIISRSSPFGLTWESLAHYLECSTILRTDFAFHSDKNVWGYLKE